MEVDAGLFYCRIYETWHGDAYAILKHVFLFSLLVLCVHLSIFFLCRLLGVRGICRICVRRAPTWAPLGGAPARGDMPPNRDIGLYAFIYYHFMSYNQRCVEIMYWQRIETITRIRFD